ncbi:hypothetical protein ARMSODRAFT_1005056 [Armillaria solidipes]|uniref:Uncharacterized protein n=1 Tax=Armillaria solidipes TaxID=1076256 RepID=A0A2H3BM59_9AGAR|nr:hypothetical protein ARMSODRAFT_1005056 [Armillaria solidipes]
MANTTTNEAARPSNLNAVNVRATEEQFDEGAASEDEGYDSEEEDDDSEHEWSKESLTFKYMAAHEPFTALPVHYLRFTRCALLPPKFALGIGVDDMDDGFELARHLVPNEPVEDSSMLLTTLIRRLRDRTNLDVRATPVRSKEVGFVFYTVTSWDENFDEAPAQRDIMNAMLREINWRENIKWYIVGTWMDKYREDYNRPVLYRDA